MQNIAKRKAAPPSDTGCTQETPESHLRFAKGFTLTELLVLVAIGAVLTGLLLPDLSQTHSKLLQAACATNMRQLGMAVYLYAEDYGRWFYANTNPWGAGNPLIARGVGTDAAAGYRARRLRGCPAALATLPESLVTGSGPVMYAFNRPNGNTPSGWRCVTIYQGTAAVPASSYNFKTIPKPAQFMVLVDVAYPWSAGNIFFVSCSNLSCFSPGACNDFFPVVSPVTNRHSGGVNVLFADQHVAFEPMAKLQAESNKGTLSGWFASEKPADPSIVIDYSD